MLRRNIIIRLHQCTLRSLLVSNRSHHEDAAKKKGAHAVVIGCYKNTHSELTLTDSGNSLQHLVARNFLELLHLSNFKGDAGSCRSFYDVHADYPCITIAGLGDDVKEYDENEGMDENRENVRIGIGSAVKELLKQQFTHISVDSCGGFAAASAEGAHLAGYVFDQYKSKKSAPLELELFDLNEGDGGPIVEEEGWKRGVVMAESQNYARELMETPSNYKYPELFAQAIFDRFSQHSAVSCVVRDEEWLSSKSMQCLLSVGEGSVHRSKVVELHYNGAQDADSKPVLLVGKGVTFDSGGISIKPSKGMGLMRADMGGAACVLATLEALVRLNVCVNVVVLVGLVENMPSGSATRPGDVITAMNGRTVEVDNTDAEGRLVLADLLCYADEFSPSYVVNAATLTGAMDVALGAATTGTFTTCDRLWQHLHEAGQVTGDRMWRMPLYNYYTKQMQCSDTADLRNTQKKAGSAGSCTAAAFLKEFVTTNQWAHLDIAGVMADGGHASPYIGSGMSGRPTRTLIETVCRIADE